jgi:hypothetical protein
MIQCHVPNKTESVGNSCENFNFPKRPCSLQEQKCVFRKFIYIPRQEFTSYVKNQSKLKSSYKVWIPSFVIYKAATMATSLQLRKKLIIINVE